MWSTHISSSSWVFQLWLYVSGWLCKREVGRQPSPNSNYMLSTMMNHLTSITKIYTDTDCDFCVCKSNFCLFENFMTDRLTDKTGFPKFIIWRYVFPSYCDGSMRFWSPSSVAIEKRETLPSYKKFTLTVIHDWQIDRQNWLSKVHCGWGYYILHVQVTFQFIYCFSEIVITCNYGRLPFLKETPCSP